jgi:aldose 1-epimerase
MNRLLLFLFLIPILSLSCTQVQHLPLMEGANYKTVIDGKSVSLYTLVNKQGLTLQVTNFGCRVVTLFVPDRYGKMDDIVLGHENINEYVNKEGGRFWGAIVGRYANRIAGGKFSLNGEDYQLSTSDNGQCLHGGNKGFDMVVWTVDSVAKNYIAFSYLSKDMEEGFPGNLSVKVVYSLTSNNEFRIDYSATADKLTPINLTHHSLFNLKGEGNGTINTHKLCISADKYTPVDSVLIPIGTLADVSETPFDFRLPIAIGSRLNENNIQLAYCKGYDHNFVLRRNSTTELEFAASVYEPSNGRYMEVWTTEPGLQFYGGNSFDGKTIGKSGKPYKYRGGFALETQHFPDSPNHKKFPSTILKPNELYRQICIYKFKVK